MGFRFPGRQRRSKKRALPESAILRFSRNSIRPSVTPFPSWASDFDHRSNNMYNMKKEKLLQPHSQRWRRVFQFSMLPVARSRPQRNAPPGAYDLAANARRASSSSATIAKPWRRCCWWWRKLARWKGKPNPRALAYRVRANVCECVSRKRADANFDGRFYKGTNLPPLQFMVKVGFLPSITVCCQWKCVFFSARRFIGGEEQVTSTNCFSSISLFFLFPANIWLICSSARSREHKGTS